MLKIWFGPTWEANKMVMGNYKAKAKGFIVSCFIVLIFAWCFPWPPGAFGFSTDGSTLARNFSRTIAGTNSGIVVTVTFTNGTSLALRGFYFAEQLPSALTVTPLSINLNGISITNYIFETGQDGDVYAGSTPWRWVLEQPSGFTQNNPIPADGIVQIIYSATSASSGTFSLAEFEWAGFALATTNASLGYSETAEKQSLTFLANSPPAIISVHAAANAFDLHLDSLAGCTYILQASTNLSDWVPLVTNTTPFDFSDTSLHSFPARFYRGRWLP
jgi:hypothetical protein